MLLQSFRLGATRHARPFVLACAAWLLTGAAHARTAAEGRPNILFILSDDHATAAVGCYGSRINQTPNLDRLAREGMLFRHCLCTNALCGPSRAVVLTGKYSHKNGFLKNGDRFDGSQTTMPKLLKAAGYQTAVIGKWHLESDPTGFDHYQVLIGQGPYYNPVMIENGARVRREGYTTDVITDLALDFLKKRDAGKPFLLMYQHKAPHREWQPAPRHMDLFEEQQIAEPENLFDDYRGRTGAAQQQEMTIARHLTDLDLKLAPPNNLLPDQLAAWKRAFEPHAQFLARARLTQEGMTRWKYQRYIKDYLRCVTAIDESVGRVLDYLDEADLARNTVVIYTSDQGFFLGEHGWYDKRFMYEEALHMPLLVRWPGKVRAASVSSDLVSNVDFAQTLLEIAQVAPPEGVQGQSLVPLLLGQRPKNWRSSFYYHYYEYPAVHMVRRHYGVRTARHKLIHFYGLNEWELYDLQKDPREMHSVYDDPAYEPVRRELKAELERLRATLEVPDDQEPQSARGGPS
jgi:arylsulfatase A-like enzyme